MTVWAKNHRVILGGGSDLRAAAANAFVSGGHASRKEASS
jgi:hypothetical protein